jgi:hypothetical protein
MQDGKWQNLTLMSAVIGMSADLSLIGVMIKSVRLSLS